MEPPGEDVPAGGDDPAAEVERPRRRDGGVAGPLDPLRASAAFAAAALSLLATGHVFVLAALLVVVAATRTGAVAVLLACTAVLVRWGNPSLGAAAGAQAVLGPAVVVGSNAAALSALLAAAAIVLTARQRVTATAFGLAAATIAAGPTFPHDLAVRVAGIVVCVAAAHVATRLPRVGSHVAVAAGAVALLLAAVG